MGVEPLRRLISGRDVGWIYAGLVLTTQTVLAVLPPTTQRAIVLASSTNLTNLRQYPPLVLCASAFMVASPWELLLLGPLVYVYGTAQRWLGRAATVIMGVLTHVGTTVFVATMLAARIHRGEAASLADATSADVGVSYGLAGLAGLITIRLPDRWRRATVVATTLVLVGTLLASRTFTNLGHLAAWTFGLGIALIARQAGVAARHAP